MTTAKNAVFNGLQVENCYSLGGELIFGWVWLGGLGGIKRLCGEKFSRWRG